MEYIPRVTMPNTIALVLFIFLAFTTQQAHSTRPMASISDYKSQQHLCNLKWHNGDSKVMDLFNRWIEKHTRVYHSWSEKQHRFQIFRENVQYIRSHNAQQKSYWMGLNKFSDLTHQEFLAQYLGGFQASRSHSVCSKADFIYNDVIAEPNVDWRKTGAVSEIKDQGQCGSCWTFSTTGGAVEAVNQIATGQMITLSEQELLDCDSPPNLGCNGGSMQRAFQYIYENGGIHTENNYPYMTHTNFQCVAKQNSTIVSIDGYELVPTQSENSLLKAVSMNPVSVAIEASGRDFQHYQGGVFTGSCGTNLDHAVLVVGYGIEEDGSPYWIVKNSWGSWWGEAGYIRMAQMGSSDPRGKCGINMDPSFPIKYATKST